MNIEELRNGDMVSIDEFINAEFLRIEQVSRPGLFKKDEYAVIAKDRVEKMVPLEIFKKRGKIS